MGTSFSVTYVTIFMIIDAEKSIIASEKYRAHILLYKKCFRRPSDILLSGLALPQSCADFRPKGLKRWNGKACHQREALPIQLDSLGTSTAGSIFST